MKTYVATVKHNPYWTKTHIEIIDAETLYPVDAFEVITRQPGAILPALKAWAEAQPVRPLRVVNFGYMTTCTLVKLE